MTKLLEEAFEKASRLPPDDQDALGQWLLAELESEARWSERLAGSQDALKRLATEALEEDDRGETEPLDPESI